MILLIKLLSFFPLFIIRLFDRKKDKNIIEQKDRYGIEAFVGLAGQGKTMSMTHELNRLRKKYGNDIYIITNYFYKYEDASFNDWRQLLYEYDKTVIVAWDELPNEWNSKNFNDFPPELFDKLTQLRKENGMKILFTAQDFKLVDISFRRLTFYVHQCKTFMDRFTYYRTYEKDDYEQYQNTTSFDRKQKIHVFDTHYFFQTQKLRESYDSYQILESAKNKEYLNRFDRAKVNSQRLI